MCAGSTKIAAPTVILKMAAASPRMPMTRRRPGSLAAGTGVLMPPKVQGLDEAAIPRSRSFARACALAQDDNATRVLYKRVWGKKKPVLGQIFPGGVTTFDQADLPQPLPALDLLLARNGSDRRLHHHSFAVWGNSFRLLLLFFPPLSLKRRACHPERAR